ncbi:molybdopterin-dependent oxidoreductase [Chromobacterium sp. ATCC 53434]|uniref:molybdopterin-dependent oxidoreductase n=1 Tax=Chromobacterium sp. (strain ATCC 53434 / SC 14030) TaxID=2059672 RepID=UPI0013054566|nr:molybdopterin-dependent oxidoreductase [Chromobacterium sp. ATCC 53434]
MDSLRRLSAAADRRCWRWLPLLLLPLSAAQALPQAADQPATLTISGRISRFTDAARKVYVLDRASLDRLPQRDIVTATDWTPLGTFRGPLLRDLLTLVGAHGSQVKFYGEDDYNITIPLSDFSRYDAILASGWNGRSLRLEDYGPFWVMYPLPRMSAAETGGTFPSKLIWQVTRMEVR